jgi:outer membrane protein assembly factor BamB
MSAGRAPTPVATALAMVLVAGCAQGASTDTRGRDRATQAWSTTVDWPFSLGVDGGDAVVTVSRNRVVDLDTVRGRERWHADLAHVTHHDPVLDDQTVLISADDRFVALERRSGALRWEASIGEHAGGSALARMHGEPIALVTTEGGAVTALDGRTGAVRWSVNVPGDILAAPAVDAGAGVAAVVWSGDGDHVGVFDLATGAQRWQAPIDPGATAPAIHRGLVVLGEGKGNFESRVVGRDVTSGAERWSTTVPASFEPGLTPGAEGDDVAVSDHFGTVTLVDTRSGTSRWQTAIREPILDTRVLLTDDAVALSTYGGEVVILDRASGRVRRRVATGGYPVGIGVSGRRLIVAVRLARPDRVEALQLP